MNRRIKAAVIGVGTMGKNHARVYNDMEDVELVAVADVNAIAAEKVARRFKVLAYVDYRQMLVMEKPDLVSVAVPTKFHHKVAIDVIEADVHLLLEKPIASTVEEAKDIIGRAEKKGIKLTIGHIERFNPAVNGLKERLDDGKLGRIFQIHARRLGPFPARVRDVGVVVDLAAHDVDVMRYVTGAEVRRVYAETQREIHTDHEDSLSGLLCFDNDIIGVLDINWLTPTKVRELSVTGEQGMFLVNYLTQDLYFYENGYIGGAWENLGVLRGVGEGNVIKFHIERREPLLVELESFVEAVADDRVPAVSGEDGLIALALTQKIVESGRRHLPLNA